MLTLSLTILQKKIPSEMEVAPRNTMLTLFTLLLLFHTVFTVYTIQTALHCLNSSMYVYIQTWNLSKI